MAQSLHDVDEHGRGRAPRAERAAGVDDRGLPEPRHPVAGCPDLRSSTCGPPGSADRVEREVGDLKRQILGRTESLARRFDQVLQLLEAWGHLDGWALTDRGERLVRIFHESDLLMAEALETGLLDDLDPAALAGMVSCFTYEHRSPIPAAAALVPVRRPSADGWSRLDQLAADLNADEESPRAARSPGRPIPASSPWPTPGRPAKPSTRCSTTRSSRAATSCATPSC